MLLNNELVNQEIKEEINICMEKNGNENTVVQNLWATAETVSKREVYSNTGVH